MSVTTKKIVKQVGDIELAVQGMHEAMEKTPAIIEERQLKVTEFKKKFPDAKYIEPDVRIPTGGVKHPEMEKQREYLHEYVIGVFESQMITGQLEFFLTGLPGDDYCRWKIPVNKTIGIPRFVARHLSSQLGWKEMKPLGRNQEPQAFSDEEITTPFTNFETRKRGTFHPINSY